MKKSSTIIIKGLVIVLGVVFFGTAAALMSIYLSPIALVLIALSVIIAATIIFFVKQNKAKARLAGLAEAGSHQIERYIQPAPTAAEALRVDSSTFPKQNNEEARLAGLAEAGSHQIERYIQPTVIKFSIPVPARSLLPKLFFESVIKEILLGQLAASGTHQIVPYTPPRLTPLTLNNIFAQFKLEDFRPFNSIPGMQKDFFLAEIFGHELAYKLAKNKIRAENGVLLTDQSGKEGVFDIIKIQPDRSGHEALHGYIILPQNLDNPHVHIVWAGTINIDGILVDSQISPGEDSYRKREVWIIGQINSALCAHYMKVRHKLNLHFYGHSLGGALAQLTFHSAQRAILQNAFSSSDRSLKTIGSRDIDALNLAQNPTRRTQWAWSEYVHRRKAPWNVNLSDKGCHSKEGFSSEGASMLNSAIIESMHVATWNSAGVTSAVAAHSVENAGLLSEIGVMMSAHFGVVAGDAIQTSGEATILAGCNHNVAQVNVMKVGDTIGAGLKAVGTVLTLVPGAVLGTMVAIPGLIAASLYFAALPTIWAHKGKHFVIGSEIVSEEYSNSTDEGSKRVYKTLSNKSTLINCLAYMKDRAAASSAVVLPPILPIGNYP